MLTGDDGQVTQLQPTTNNNKVLDNIFQDNGDGLERHVVQHLTITILFQRKQIQNHHKVLKFCGVMTML